MQYPKLSITRKDCNNPSYIPFSSKKSAMENVTSKRAFRRDASSSGNYDILTWKAGAVKTRIALGTLIETLSAVRE